MSKTQKFLIGALFGAMVVLLGWQYMQWQEQLQIHARQVEYWEVTVPQMAEQFADVENFKPLDVATGLAQEDQRLTTQKQVIIHRCLRIVLVCLLAAALVWRWPLLAAWGSGQTEAYYQKRGKESPAAKKARLRRERHYHPPKR